MDIRYEKQELHNNHDRFSIVFNISPTLASSRQGNYVGSGEGRLSLKIKGNHVSMITVSNNCLGSFEASSNFYGTHGSARQKTTNGYCDLSFNFDDRGNVSVSESESGSFPYCEHGVSCSFEGILHKK